MEVECPIKRRLLSLIQMRGVHSQRKVIGEREMHSLFKNGSDVEQYFRFLLGEYLLLLRIIEQVNGFGDLEDVPLSDASNDIDLFC